MSICTNFSVASHKLLGMILLSAALLASCGGGSGGSTSIVTTPNQTGKTSGLNKTGTGTATLSVIPATTGNTVPIVVDAGPLSSSMVINVAYVTVTVCTPGTSGSIAACQTIDHVTLDTGSYGLRLLNSSLSSSLNLPAITSNGKSIGECTPFSIGTTWGSVRYADIYIGGEVALNVPIQDIGDSPGGSTTIPKDCTSTGAIQDTQATLGSNGILGVGLFVNDCDSCLTQAIPAAYYTCTATSCTNSTITSTQVVRNPVPSFALDNNGTLIDLPVVSSAGSTGLAGTLVFGIGTRATSDPTNNIVSNAISSSALIYPTDANGNFTTSYYGTSLSNKAVSMSSSFLDSGSNGLFFNDSTLPVDAYTGWYIPSGTLSLYATNTSGSSTQQVQFSIVNAINLPANIVAGNIAGTGLAGTFAWGLPFFFGRPVYTAISGVSVSGVQTGPFWAY